MFLLTAVQGAEIRHTPIQSGQQQEVFNKADRLAERHSKHHFHSQAGLDHGVAEAPRSTVLARGFSTPVHLGFEPERKRSWALQYRLASSWSCRWRSQSALALQLSRWIVGMKPLSRFVQQSHHGRKNSIHQSYPDAFLSAMPMCRDTWHPAHTEPPSPDNPAHGGHLRRKPRRHLHAGTPL
jgi:hypothetical protein